MSCYALVFGVAIAATALSLPLASSLARRARAVARRPQIGDLDPSPVPLLGGLAVIVGVVAGLLTGASMGAASALPHAVGLGGGALLIVSLGVFDDLRGATVAQKLVVQAIAASLVVGAGLVMPLGELVGVSVPPVLEACLTVLWIVAITNAVNMVDGMDGLATATSALALLPLVVLGAAPGLLCAALLGALLGFLPFNVYPARMFLGDTGSLFLGFALAVLGLLTLEVTPTGVGVVVVGLALLWPLLELGTSVVRRSAAGQPVHRSDLHHLHHQLLRGGLSPRRALAAICLAAGLASLGGAGLALQRTTAEIDRVTSSEPTLGVSSVDWMAEAQP